MLFEILVMIAKKFLDQDEKTVIDNFLSSIEKTDNLNLKILLKENLSDFISDSLERKKEQNKIKTRKMISIQIDQIDMDNFIDPF